MAIAHNLGFPPLGANRELKRATEGYWSGKVSRAALLQTGAELRAAHWRLQRDAGVDLIPSNDFSYYDRVLDTCAMVGAVPARYGWSGGPLDLDSYFAMARGVPSGGRDVTAMEMTKWFDTNYHYIVPEFEPGQTFRLASTKVIDEFNEAKALGFHTKPALIGPVTFLLLGKTRGEGAARFDRLELLEALLPVYGDALARLAAAGATWVQLDEPCLALDRTTAELAAYARAYRFLAERAPQLQLLVATYFAGLDDNLATARDLPVAGLHVDLVRARAGQLDQLLKAWPKGRVLSLGMIDGRNIWRADLGAALGLLERARERIGADDLWVAPSCSLLHVPVDLDLERRLDAELKSWLAFAKQKLVEVATLARAVRDGRAAVAAELEANARLIAGRRSSRRIHEPAVKQRAAGVSEKDMRRASPHAARRKRQLRLPVFPTTTIGSFPQTAEVRAARKKLHDGKLTPQEYDAFIADQIARTLKLQEELGLDVLVHGEFERNDMVEYFGEQLQGFAFTEHGWVQSYGTRYVKPPLIYGDVSRPKPMTVRWSTYAQSRTSKPVKGMLTGPVTILQWSFVRDDQPRAETAKQLALAIRDEVKDLEAAGIRVIQIDEPALREGLPLRRAEWPAYLDWAVNAFRLATSSVSDATQIHTHMCYSEFNDVIRVIEKMDADVISIENARSGSELLEAFKEYKYPNEIGPGVYDIHSPRVPSAAEIGVALKRMQGVLNDRQIWVNPDCGLKTRGWEETLQALRNMVQAARQLRPVRTAVAD
ncbi:MAG: 5-methyltetrahydropteroyltriglutamate--homocysteine S-methyltransferase [Gemmatimonadetes bacterium 13_1_40CM_4_69_8]|nr:MAG: 5-methyltetrahydropteroyltriglutamate--homocysteine S-methyltransferase [Gemmatimonadetes bacterium 13_1_40CM_69_22]OLC69634.1 MAG: 5-methyltetrahydropteroyltriglutamate--homocysteine S-methyltransferase [Gemmatimonadetes bacterium 13_1_40CM_4_69_8]